MGDETNIVEGQSLGFDRMEEALGGLPKGPDPKETKDVKEEPEEGADDTSDDSGERRAKAAKDLKEKSAKDVDDEDGDEEEPDTEPEPEEDKGKDGKKKPTDNQKKAYRTKIGDKDVDIPPDAKFKVPVDGKLQDVSLADLASNYNGKVVYEKKFNELARSKQTFEGARKELNDSIASVYKLATEKNDPRGMVYFIAETMGADPVKIWKDTVKSVANALKQAGVAVDDSAIEARFKDDELDYHRSSRERETERGKAARVAQEYQDRSKKIQDRFGKDSDGNPVLSDKVMVETFDEMIASGKYRADEIEPETLADYFSEKFAGQVAKKVVASLGDDIENVDRAVELLTETKLKFPEFTEEDLLAAAKEAFGGTGKAAKRLSKKVRQTERGIPPTRRRSEKGSEALKWDDID